MTVSLLLLPTVVIFIMCFQKIERLKGELHLLDADGKQTNKHTFFVESAKEGKRRNCENSKWHGGHPFSLHFLLRCVFVLCVFSVESFDLATHLQTAPELVDRVYNRPTMETLETKRVQGNVNPKSIMVCLCMLAFYMKLFVKSQDVPTRD